MPPTPALLLQQRSAMERCMISTCWQGRRSPTARRLQRVCGAVVLAAVCAALYTLGVSTFTVVQPWKASSVKEEDATSQWALSTQAGYCTHSSFQHVHPAWALLPVGIIANETAVHVPGCDVTTTLLVVNTTAFLHDFFPTRGRCAGVTVATIVSSPVPHHAAISPVHGSCLMQCMASYCCVGFQVLVSPDGTTVRCALLQCFHYRSPAYRVPSKGVPLYLLKHTRIGPLHTHLSTPQLQFLSPQDDTLRLPEVTSSNRAHAIAEVGLFLPSEVDSAFSEQRSSSCNVTFQCHGWQHSAILGNDAMLLMHVSAPQELVNGAATFKVGAMLEQLYQHVGSHVMISAAARCWVRASATISLTAHVRAIVHMSATHRGLLYWDPEEAHASNGAAQLRQRVFRDPQICAPLLRPSECCLRGVVAVHFNGAHLPQGLTTSRKSEYRRASDASTVGLQVALSTADSSNNCWSISDGFYSQYDAHGEAAFPHLVVRNRCPTNATAASLGNVVLTLREASPRGLTLFRSVLSVTNVTIPAVNFKGCGASTTDVGGDGDSRLLSRPLMDRSEVTPLLISITAYRCERCIVDLLDNVAAFAAPSVVVLHVNPNTWPLHRQPADVQRLETIHPRWVGKIVQIVVNTDPKDHEPSIYLHYSHLYNVHFMETRHGDTKWSHVVFFQSNERFVKQGVLAYVKRFNASNPVPTPQGGMSFGHFAEFAARQFVTLPQSFRREFSFADGVDSLLRDLDTHRLLERRRSGSNKSSAPPLYPTGPVLLEGTFLSRALAVGIARDAMLSLNSERCVVSDIVSEYALSMVLHQECQRPAIRCGEPVSTLVWSDTHRHLTGQANVSRYEASAADVLRLRCSPFEAPFAMKRFSMDPSSGHRSDALKLLDAIQRDHDRLHRRRDILKHCEEALRL